MQAVVPETRVEVTPRFDVPALQPEEEGEAETLVRHLTGDNASHKVSYGTEAGQFQEAPATGGYGFFCHTRGGSTSEEGWLPTLRWFPREAYRPVQAPVAGRASARQPRPVCR